MAVATNSGSEAIDVSIRIARKWGYQVKGIPRGEALILTASANYHGRTMMPLSSSENPKYREGGSQSVNTTCILVNELQIAVLFFQESAHLLLEENKYALEMLKTWKLYSKIIQIRLLRS